MKQNNILTSTTIDTPLGEMIVIGDDEALYLLDFHDRKLLHSQIKTLSKNTGREITTGHSKIFVLIREEINDYFYHRKQSFTTPIKMVGTSFQIKVWQELKKIPYSKTNSYGEIASKINPLAFRAVANANSKNRLAIIVPCHRVIYQNGKLGGYAGGLSRKEWLLQHEKLIIHKSK